jgi:hypothetical protein
LANDKGYSQFDNGRTRRKNYHLPYICGYVLISIAPAFQKDNVVLLLNYLGPSDDI